MSPRHSGAKSETIEVEGKIFVVTVREFPFRENVELECAAFDPPIRVSDLQLGRLAALEILKAEITRRLS